MHSHKRSLLYIIQSDDNDVIHAVAAEDSVTSQPLSREMLCRMICSFENQQLEPILFKDQLYIARGPNIKLRFDARGSGNGCNLICEASISERYWPQSNLTIGMTLTINVGTRDKSNKFECLSDLKCTHMVTLDRNDCLSPHVQTTILHGIVPHKIIFYEKCNWSLLVSVTATLQNSHFNLQICDSQDECVNIDFNDDTI